MAHEIQRPPTIGGYHICFLALLITPAALVAFRTLPEDLFCSSPSLLTELVAMECTRTVSHTYASCSGMLRPSRTYSKITVSRPAPRFAQRLALRPCAVASISAPGSNSVGAPVQESPSVLEVCYPLPF